MTIPFAYSGLYNKAKLFTNRSLAAKAREDFDEAALWASLALELLAKAALAKVNPCLIADPVDDAKSLLTAAGLSKDYAGFRTIPAKAAFSRCARAFRPFNADEALRFAANRNDDVHSAALPFASLDEDQWWQRYWAQAVLLLHAQDLDVDDFVGAIEAVTVEEYLAKNTEYVRARVSSLIERAVQRLELASSSSASANGGERLKQAVFLDYAYYADQACPACGKSGRLYGDYVVDSQEQSPLSWDGEHEPSSWEDITVLAEAFTCLICGLTLEGQEFVEAASLPETFESEREIDFGGEEYMNE